MKIYLHMVDSKYGCMLPENKDVVQGLNKQKAKSSILSVFSCIPTSSSIKFNLTKTFTEHIVLSPRNSVSKDWKRLGSTSTSSPAGLQRPALSAKSRQKLQAISRLGIQEERQAILFLTSKELWVHHAHRLDRNIQLEIAPG